MKFKGFILGNVVKDFQIRYSNSLLGFIWAILSPLAMIIIYTVIFSKILNAKIPGNINVYGYSIYLCIGIITWNLYSEIFLKNLNIFIEYAHYIKKLVFPKIILPLIVSLTSLVNFFIIFTLFILFLVITNSFPGLVIFHCLPLIFLQVLLANSLGLILGIFNVFFKDISHFFSIFMQFWFWFTPIVYPLEIVPIFFRDIMVFNPLYPIISGYHNIFVSNTSPDYANLIWVFFLAITTFVIAIKVYRKYIFLIVDEI